MGRWAGGSDEGSVELRVVEAESLRLQTLRHHPLALEPMREAAAHLLGVHDFSSFRAAECQARSPVKELRWLDILRKGDMLVLQFAADAFLHHMVRNIVGCLVKVGNGSRAPRSRVGAARRQTPRAKGRA